LSDRCLHEGALIAAFKSGRRSNHRKTSSSTLLTKLKRVEITENQQSTADEAQAFRICLAAILQY
jgi:hypothetical protein